MLVSLFCLVSLSIIIVNGCVYLICSDGTLKSTSLVPNPLNADHEVGKPESSQQPEVFYMTSDIGNKPLHPYSSVELGPQEVRYYDNSDSFVYVMH